MVSPSRIQAPAPAKLMLEYLAIGLLLVGQLPQRLRQQLTDQQRDRHQHRRADSTATLRRSFDMPEARMTVSS